MGGYEKLGAASSDIEDDAGAGGGAVLRRGHGEFVPRDRLHMQAARVSFVAEGFPAYGGRGPPPVAVACHGDRGDVLEHQPFRVLQEDELFEERKEQPVEAVGRHGDLVPHFVGDRIVAPHDAEEAARRIREEPVEVGRLEVEPDVGGVFEDAERHTPREWAVRKKVAAWPHRGPGP